jgi:hypothetical protein
VAAALVPPVVAEGVEQYYASPAPVEAEAYVVGGDGSVSSASYGSGLRRRR